MYYYRNRYYDPTKARFVSEDPIGWASGQTNAYAYVGWESGTVQRSNGVAGSSGSYASSNWAESQSGFGRRSEMV
ncbi:RHS repeat-associated core domain-containing protein [Paraburkholderia sediminicola]|uniref:RHS repeat-associated core domain-containing protein n=1 Tax=Paraburkholderia sediminicola TaxID=458836 RepID=UPI0038B89A2F